MVLPMCPPRSNFLAIGFVLCAGIAAQEIPTPEREPEQGRKPIIVTATRIEEDPFELPYATESVNREQMRRRSYRTLPQALRDMPGVMVQETAHGHGSPYIRGFTSFRTLMLVDGVRLNNSVFRPGPNQYWNTVDALSLERLELVKGPSSVLYGSDAIGGTVNAITASPRDYSGKDGLQRDLSTYVRYSSAEDSIQGRGELSFGYGWENGSRTAALVGGSAKNFDDLRAGDHVETQDYTGYDETDIDIKVEHWLDEKSRLVFLHQRVHQDDVPRTHRTVFGINWRGLTNGSDLRRDFDQRRYLTYLQLHMEELQGTVDSLHASLSYQEQKERRTRVRSSAAEELQGFDVGTLGFWGQLSSQTGIGRITGGVEYYHDDVDSYLNRGAAQTPADNIQGPVGDDARYDLLGVFLQDQIDLGGDFELILGGRFNYAAADANEVRDPVTDTQINIDDDWSSFVGSARLRYGLIPDQVNVFGGISQGFRAPNLSDLTRFDSARSNEFEVPASNLDPEEYISYEVGVKAETEDFSMQTTYFYTDIRDQILRFPTGNTNPDGDSEVTKDNVGDGHIYGIEFGSALRVFEGTTLFGNLTFMEGKVSSFENAGSTLSDSYPTRLMPLSGQLGLRWEQPSGEFWAETVVVHAEEADKLSFSDERDTSRIPNGGTPGYTVWHLRGGWNINEDSSLNLLLENITNVDYRVHGSGLNRPGTNFVVSLATSF